MMRSLFILGLILSTFPFAACDDGGSKTPKGTPVVAGDFTWRLEEGPAGVALWTTPVARRIRSGDRAPADTRSGLRASAARGEKELVQLVVDPGAGDVTLAAPSDPALASAALLVGGFVDGALHTLTPQAWGTPVRAPSGGPLVLWIELAVAAAAPAGERTIDLEATLGGQGVTLDRKSVV